MLLPLCSRNTWIFVMSLEFSTAAVFWWRELITLSSTHLCLQPFVISRRIVRLGYLVGWNGCRGTYTHFSSLFYTDTTECTCSICDCSCLNAYLWQWATLPKLCCHQGRFAELSGGGMWAQPPLQSKKLLASFSLHAWETSQRRHTSVTLWWTILVTVWHFGKYAYLISCWELDENINTTLVSAQWIWNKIR